jgi:hypothetical protein
MFATYKVTFEMTQEIMGALYIQKHVTDHTIHSRLAKAVAENDHEKISSISSSLVQGDIEIIKSLISSLESGNFTNFTAEEIVKGKEYLKSVGAE